MNSGIFQVSTTSAAYRLFNLAAGLQEILLSALGRRECERRISLLVGAVCTCELLKALKFFCLPARSGQIGEPGISVLLLQHQGQFLYGCPSRFAGPYLG